MLNVLDLCAGIGGFSLGLERAGMKTVGLCELDSFCQQILKKNFPGVPVYDDVRTLTAARLAADGVVPIDIITAGYPCQPFSLAGKRQGKNDPRHVWPDVFRLVTEIRPDWCLFENVVGHVTMGLEDVLADLENAGYGVQPFIIPAAGVGASHMRDRVWIVAANTERDGWRTDVARWGSEGGVAARGSSEAFADAEERTIWPGLCSCEPGWIGGRRSCNCGCQVVPDTNIQHGNDSGYGAGEVSQRQATCLRHVVPHTNSAGLQKLDAPGEPGSPGQHSGTFAAGRKTGAVVGRLGGSSHGVSDWMDVHRIPPLAVGQKHRNKRLKALGNAVVPQIPEAIGRAILAVSEM